MVVIFAFLAVVGTSAFLDRTHVELQDGRRKGASVRALFQAHSALSRAHAVINAAMNAPDSVALGQNHVLADPEVVGGVAYVPDTGRAVRLRTVKPSDRFDTDGDELPPVDELGNETAYEALPYGWYVLEARVLEPLYTRSDGQRLGALKLVRQYVRDGTPLSNNFVAVIDDDLGLGGSPTNPGKPAEGEIQSNQHLYIMTSNPYYANRLLAVDGVSYTAGASEEDTVFLHPDNNFDAEPLELPLPDALTSNPDDPDDTLKAHALGSSPVAVTLSEANADFSVDLSGITSLGQIKSVSSHPEPTVHLNYAADGTCVGVAVEGYVDTQVEFHGDTMTLVLTRVGQASKRVTIADLPTPDNGVVFIDTRSDLGTPRRTLIQGDVTTRTTLATTGNVDVGGSVRYYDGDGDPATKLVYNDDLEGVAPADLGGLPEIDEDVHIAANADVLYYANERPPGVLAEDGDGFYDGDAVLGVVAAEDIVILSDVPENAELAGAYLSLQQRLTLEGLGYNAAGQISYVDGANEFYKNHGGRSSIRRFGGLVSYKRPVTTVVTGGGDFYYGFKRGFSLFDESMKQQPPPFFPKDKKPQYLGWELRDLGIRPMD